MSQHPQLVPEWFPLVSFQGIVGKRADGGPEGVDCDILIEVGTVIQSDSFELLEVTRELLELGETATTFLLNPNLDLTDPSTLQLDTLGDDLFP